LEPAFESAKLARAKEITVDALSNEPNVLARP
jgi:hypothetical protein